MRTLTNICYDTESICSINCCLGTIVYSRFVSNGYQMNGLQSSISNSQLINIFKIKLYPEMSQDNQIKVRCLVVGPASSGKSTFVKRVVNSPVSSDYLMSSRISLHRKSYAQVNKPYQLEVVFMECPGKDLYHKLLFQVSNQIGPKCLIIGLYDVTNRTSIASLESFLNTLTKQINKSVELCGILLANKIDLVDKRIISNNEGQQKAKMFKYRYFECSAQNDISMHEFHQLVIDVIEANFITNTNSLSLKAT